MHDADSDLKLREERKREANSDPLQRWQILQDLITWSESLPTVRRNTPAKCRELERKKLGR